MLVIHVLSMVITTIAAVVKSLLLLIDRKVAFHKVQRTTGIPVKILLIVGVIAGVYVIVTKFGGIVPPWLIIKIAMFITGGIVVMISEKRENKYGLLIGTLILLLVIVQANVKLS